MLNFMLSVCVQKLEFTHQHELKEVSSWNWQRLDHQKLESGQFFHRRTAHRPVSYPKVTKENLPGRLSGDCSKHKLQERRDKGSKFCADNERKGQKRSVQWVMVLREISLTNITRQSFSSTELDWRCHIQVKNKSIFLLIVAMQGE